jgi:hypothetical protein
MLCSIKAKSITIQYLQNKGYKSEIIDYETGEITNQTKFNENSIKNLEKGIKNKSGFGSSAEKRFNKYLSNYSLLLYQMQISNNNYFKYHFKNKFHKRKPTFITLTTNNQTYSDKMFYKNCFCRFLQEIKRKYNIKLYIWKSEVQKNGNIHYHLLLDKYLFHLDARKIWFKILSENKQITNDIQLNTASRIIWIVPCKNITNFYYYFKQYCKKSLNDDKILINKHDKETIIRNITTKEYGCSDEIRNIQTSFNIDDMQLIKDIITNSLDKIDIKSKKNKIVSTFYKFYLKMKDEITNKYIYKYSTCKLLEMYDKYILNKALLIYGNDEHNYKIDYLV